MAGQTYGGVEVGFQPKLVDCAVPIQDNSWSFSSHEKRIFLQDVELAIVPDISVGTCLSGKYQLIEKVGEGGMSSVYRANDILLKRVVAIKMLIASRRLYLSAVRRFHQEGQAVSRLNHPNLLRVFGFDTSDEGEPYLVMEYLEGVSLAELLKREVVLSVERCIKLFLPIVDGLAHAHEQGIVHRDIKPSNILVVQQNELEVPKIVDFGIAKLLYSDNGLPASTLTQTGEIFGSPVYMSPEHCDGREVDQRTDQYALGCVLYECLTGAPPHVGKSCIETLLKHQTEEPLSLREASLGREFPSALEEIVRRTLAKDPQARYGSMKELQQALEALDSFQASPRVIKNSSSRLTLLLALIAASCITLLISAWCTSAWLMKTQFGISPKETNLGSTQTRRLDKQPLQREVNGFTIASKSEIDQERMIEIAEADSFLKKSISEFPGTADWKAEGISDAGLSYLGHLQNITTLELNSPYITGRGLKNIRRLPILQLTTHYCPIGDDGVRWISEMPKLKTLSLRAAGITEKSLKILGQKTLLTSLSLRGNNLNNEGIECLARSQHIKLLDLSDNPEVSDRSIFTLKRLSDLEALVLIRTAITDEAVDAIGNQFKKIRFLNISKTAITDRGLKKLSQCKKLEHLDIEDCSVSEKMVEYFKQQNPRCKLMN